MNKTQGVMNNVSIWQHMHKMENNTHSGLSRGFSPSAVALTRLSPYERLIASFSTCTHVNTVITTYMSTIFMTSRARAHYENMFLVSTYEPDRGTAHAGSPGQITKLTVMLKFPEASTFPESSATNRIASAVSVPSDSISSRSRASSWCAISARSKSSK